jgi:uncharacterized protein (DUF58 family)
VPRTYRISKGAVAYYVGFSLVWFGGIVGFVIIGQLEHDWAAASIGAVLFTLLIALVPALQLAWSIPYEVTLSDDEGCEFHSLLRRKHVRVPQIRSISADEDDLYIRHDGGKVHLVGVAGFKDLLVRLVELNPAIDVEGWLRHALEEVPSTTRASRDG